MSITDRVGENDKMDVSIHTIESALSQITAIPSVGPVRVSLEDIFAPEFVVYTNGSHNEESDMLLHQIDTIIRIKAGIKAARVSCKKMKR
jgi:hypothetical protein